MQENQLAVRITRTPLYSTPKTCQNGEHYREFHATRGFSNHASLAMWPFFAKPQIRNC